MKQKRKQSSSQLILHQGDATGRGPRRTKRLRIGTSSVRMAKQSRYERKGSMRRQRRKDLKVRMLLDIFGATCSFLGLSGLAGAAEGEGKAIVALIVFLIGVVEVAWSYQR